MVAFHVNVLERRAVENGENFSGPALWMLRGDWYLGDLTFRDPLLALVEMGFEVLLLKRSHAAGPIKWHREEKGKRVLIVSGKPGFPRGRKVEYECLQRMSRNAA